MQGYPITFNIYAENEQEADDARQAIVAFIGLHAQHGRAVTGKKVAAAVNGWDKNPIVKSQIINYFK